MNRSTRTPSRLVLTIAFTITALLLGIIGAVAAGTGTVTPPPKIAFVTTNANVAPDALTVGPMAGRLGAPLFITDKDTLGEDTKNALVAYGPQLIIIAGGPNTVTDAVVAQIAAATGLAIKEFDDKPDSGIIRAFGVGRDQTAARLSELIANYNPKFLPTDATAADADLLDGKNSTAFLGKTEKAADADKLDGLNSADLQGSWHTWIDGHSSTFSNAGNADLIGVDVTLGDPCGGGTTIHTLHATFTGNVDGSTAAYFGGAITTDDEAFETDQFGTGWPTSYTTWYGDGPNSVVETPWTAQRILELGPGSYRIRFGATVESGATTPSILFPTFVVNRVQVSCP